MSKSGLSRCAHLECRMMRNLKTVAWEIISGRNSLVVLPSVVLCLLVGVFLIFIIKLIATDLIRKTHYLVSAMVLMLAVIYMFNQRQPTYLNSSPIVFS